jgi:hypothetical protein
VTLDLVIKSKDAIIIGPRTNIDLVGNAGRLSQTLEWNGIPNDDAFKIFFNDWNTFEEGWCIAGSLTVSNGDDDILSVISNEIPITQDIFSIYTNFGSEKIIDISDMNITQYTLVNKIENNIVQIERPNESKSNIIQPVFFRANDTETLFIHPAVTENVSIRLDEYKSKVEMLILQIDGCRFNSIGESQFGTIFKITANTLPASANAGTYYILNENLELVTTGKYNCIR